MPRRVSLPGADELFRTTGGMALQSTTSRQHSNGEAAGAYTRALELAQTEPERRFLSRRLTEIS